MPDVVAEVEVLISAEDAYPALERKFLQAQSDIVMGFRVFDPRTKLRSAEARAIGETWVDLLVHVLQRGVKITLYLSDFDPVAATELHGATWRSVRILCGVREIAGDEAAELIVYPVIHPARLGWVPRLLLRPFVSAKIRKLQQKFASGTGRKRRALARIPGVRTVVNTASIAQVPNYPATHHQKTAVIDGRWVYIGGLDLDERRFDSWSHDRPSQQTWHDVQVMIDDPAIAAQAADHLSSFVSVVCGQSDPVQTPDILRTLSRRRSRRQLFAIGPETVLSDIADRHIAEISVASGLIYLETQFFRDKRIAQALANRAVEQPDLNLVLVLPAAPETVAFEDDPKLDGRYGDYLQIQCLRKIRKAFGERLLVVSPVQRRLPAQSDHGAQRATLHEAPVIYVHSKVSVFGDRAAIVSSANLNGRSMRWDTETGVVLNESAHLKTLKNALWSHWWPNDPAFENGDAGFDEWCRAVEENVKTPPNKRQGFLVPYDQGAAQAMAIPMPGMPEEMV
ncbi:hypothetical protein BVC71_14495 [Marivivens niveibacter]|uniref:Phospholipase D n=2 Tax=Marivivens niveibacter TaxID=1930667 RepID=A0A251WVT6_9RHOB|nr:hypothetical protein BVC71_14495 [Marivivens niveibacter]